MKKKARKRRRLPAEVIALLTPAAQAKHLAETDEPVVHMDIDDDPAQPGVNPDEVDPADDGLDDLIFVIDDGEGGEQIINVGEPMDVGLAGDFVQGRQA